MICNVCYGQDPYCKMCCGQSEPPAIDPKRLAKEIADYVRTYEFSQGDQYGSWIGTSPDAEILAKAIEANFC